MEPIHVDHSVPGAYGFIIYTSEGSIVYMGDIRLHGTKPQMTRDFISSAKEAKPIAIICEGTRIADEAKEESEELVYRQSSKIVSDTDRLVFADFNFKDVDRLRTFYNIAKESDRKLVVKLNDAYYLKYLSQDKILDVPNIDDEDIIIYLPKRGSGSYSNTDYNTKDGQFLDLDNTWTAQQITADESRMLCALGFYSFTALIDMRPRPGARYIHSASEPYNEEQELSQERIDARVDHFGMNKFQSHCSGHSRAKDLLEVVSEIGEKISTSGIWELITKSLEGDLEEKNTNVFYSSDYGKIYRNRITRTICDKFGAEIDHKEGGNEITFNLEYLTKIGKIYENNEKMRIRPIDNMVETDSLTHKRHPEGKALVSDNLKLKNDYSVENKHEMESSTRHESGESVNQPYNRETQTKKKCPHCDYEEDPFYLKVHLKNAHLEK